MVIDERARRALHQQLEAALGGPAADTLMDSLPPIGWADIATKADVDARFDAVDRRFDAVDRRFEALEATFQASLQTGLAGIRTEMAAQTRTLVFALIAAATSFGGLVLAAARLG
ncbi:MAG: hypothetical protein ACR2G7_01125 [Acidimicrobiales bacterium]